MFLFYWKKKKGKNKDANVSTTYSVFILTTFKMGMTKNQMW